MTTKVKQEVCNHNLLKDTNRITKESTEVIKASVDFFISEVKKTITEGAFETVLVPNFGKFRVKAKHLQYVSHRKGMKRGQIIYSNRDARSRTKQRMDLPDPRVQELITSGQGK